MELNSLEDVIAYLSTGIMTAGPGNPRFSDERYKPYPLSDKNIKEINQVDSGRKIAFVDGGNINLISSPSFSVHLVRIYFNIFENNCRVNPVKIPSRIDFYTLAQSKIEKNEIHFEGKIFPVNENHKDYLPSEKLSFNSWDPTLVSGGFRADINKVCTTARRFAEWYLAGKIAEEELGNGDLLVRDGTLQTSVTNEAYYANQAYRLTQDNGVIFSALAKTCTLYTDTGNSLAKVIRDIGDKKLPGKSWYYHPVADIQHPDHKAELFFTKLHGESKYVFRFEINRDQTQKMDTSEMESIISSLAKNSMDMSFPGYPYGLIDADRFARVQMWEHEQHRVMLMAEASKAKRWDEMEKFLSSTNAHDILMRVGGI